MVKPIRQHTRFERARIIGARALQIGMGAPLNAPEDVLREAFKEELVSLYGLDEASVRFVLDPLKIAMYEYENELIPIDTDPHEDRVTINYRMHIRKTLHFPVLVRHLA